MKQGAEQWTEKINQAVSAVFQSMIGSDLEHVDGQLDPAQFGLTAIIGLTGDPAGVLSISCEPSAASKIAARMLGDEMSESEEYARDALGEVCNMAAGNLKSSLPKPEDRCQLSVPTVVCGTDYRIKSLLCGEKHFVAFCFEGEPIAVTLQIQH